MKKEFDSDLLGGLNQLKSSIFNQNIAQIDSINKLNSQFNTFSDIVGDLLHRYQQKIAELEKQNEELKNEIKQKKGNGKINSTQQQSKDWEQNVLQIQKERKQMVKRQDFPFQQVNPQQQKHLPSDHFDMQFEENSFQSQKSRLDLEIAKLPTVSSNRESAHKKKCRKKSKNSQNAKTKQSRLLVKEQLSTIERFAERQLKQKLKYNDDHQLYQIPKKFILVLYDRWCLNNKREILIDSLMIVQMALTNHLKRLFPLIDSSTGYYRGLLFYDANYSKDYRIFPQLLARLVNKHSEKN